MCSISGVLSVSGCTRDADPKASVQSMNGALRHRGPDDRGVFEFISDAHQPGKIALCLGNTRLAIIDTSMAGHQPMVDVDTGNCLTYNGETYNFRELRKEIGDQFGEWYSSTDTEVVLRAYRKWGLGAFARLRGMFALAIWDQREGQLILARDRFGVKPLYYFRSPNDEVLLFASEVRALLASGLVESQLSPRGVASYLAYGSIQSPQTIIENVYSLMPGECLVVKPLDQKLDIHSSSFTTNVKKDSVSPNSRAEIVKELRARLEDSVRAHLVSDVPLGVFLSGGMDSSSLVALMSRVSGEPPKTFSVVFDIPDFSEAPHSRAVANQFRTEHYEVLLEERRILALLPEAITSFDQPSMDGINAYVVSKAVKDAGITVALSGLGGDELFAGYPSFRRLQRLQSTSTIAKRLLRTVSGAGKFALNGSVRRKKFWQLVASKGTAADVYRITRQLFPPETVSVLTEHGFEEEHCNNGHFDGSADPINELSRLEAGGYMANTLLRDTDTMSMAHSLEVRVPYVDVDVADYAFAVPGSWKLNGKPPHLPKPLLADAVSDLLPREFMSRRKMGFTLPFEKWMRSTLRNEISSVLTDRYRLNKAGLDSNAAVKVWDNFLKSPLHVGWSRPWALYVLAKWCEVNRVTT